MSKLNYLAVIIVCGYSFHRASHAFLICTCAYSTDVHRSTHHCRLLDTRLYNVHTYEASSEANCTNSKHLLRDHLYDKEDASYNLNCVEEISRPGQAYVLVYRIFIIDNVWIRDAFYFFFWPTY